MTHLSCQTYHSSHQSAQLFSDSRSSRGGGLGDLAIRYGYQRFDTRVMIVTVVLLIVLVQLTQVLGDLIAQRLRKR